MQFMYSAAIVDWPLSFIKIDRTRDLYFRLSLQAHPRYMSIQSR